MRTVTEDDNTHITMQRVFHGRKGVMYMQREIKKQMQGNIVSLFPCIFPLHFSPLQTCRKSQRMCRFFCINMYILSGLLQYICLCQNIYTDSFDITFFFSMKTAPASSSPVFMPFAAKTTTCCSFLHNLIQRLIKRIFKKCSMPKALQEPLQEVLQEHVCAPG